MNLNKINVEVYIEILNDFYLFLSLNPDSSHDYFDYTQIYARDGYVKYDNPSLYSDMFDYSIANGVIDIKTEKRKHFNPMPDLFPQDTPLHMNPFGGEYDHYKIKVNKKQLDDEHAKATNSIMVNSDERIVVHLVLNSNKLVINSELGEIVVAHLRSGSSPYIFLNYVINAKPEQTVTRTDLEKHGIRLSDTLSEILRKSHINKSIKEYFVPLSTANSVKVVPQTKLTRKQWNELLAGLKSST